MSEMVEKVAKAMQDRHYQYTGTLYAENIWRQCAEAAIAAMREPTKPMMDALGNAVLDNAGNGRDPLAWDKGYRVLIDAALTQ